MGLLFRPRRPLLRLATGAATAGIAYRAGKRRARQAEYDEQTAAAYQASPSVPAPRQAAPADDQLLAQLSRLADLHASGQLSDAEYTAAKAKLLGT
jgi:Short C-terminal domain